MVSADMLSPKLYVTRSPLRSHLTRPETMTLLMASNECSLAYPRRLLGISSAEGTHASRHVSGTFFLLVVLPFVLTW